MYKLADVSRAVGLGAPTLLAWLDRKIVDIPANGTGNHRQFSKRDVERIGIVVELTRAGLPVSDSAKAAAVFADQAQDGRAAGTLFPTGKTVLVIKEGGARCVNADERDAFESAMAAVYADVPAVTIMNCDLVLANVDRALAAGTHTTKPPATAIYRHGRQMYT
jgi:DNA-binding transcriptional MerR regulator